MDLPAFFAGLVALREAAINSSHGVFCDFVDFGGDAIGLRKRLAASRQVDEMVNIRSGPAVDSLVVVACRVHPFGFGVEDVSDVPLERAEVLGLIQKDEIEFGTVSVGLADELIEQVGEVVEPHPGFVISQALGHVVDRVPVGGDSAGIVLVAQRYFTQPRQIDQAENRIVARNERRQVIIEVPGFGPAQRDTDGIAKFPVVLFAHDLFGADIGHGERQRVQRPEMNQILFRIQPEAHRRALFRFMGGFAGESKKRDAMRRNPL